jgi:hypothetical protein
MAEKSFSRHELYVLRNDISIDMLIKDILHIPCESRQDSFSFLCPLCRGYNTGVNYKTNLARCFDCQKNLNTIDMVMIVRQSVFVDSVRFLKKVHEGASCCHAPKALKAGSSSPDDTNHIAPMLASLVKPAMNNPGNDHQYRCSDKDLSARILRLEQKTAALGLQVDKLIKTMDRLFPSS